VKLTDIAPDMLPLWHVEVRHKEGPWRRFTCEPFRDRKDADNHRAMLLAQYEDPDGEARVVPYGKQEWQEDIFRAVEANDQAIRWALLCVSMESLVGILKKVEADMTESASRMCDGSGMLERNGTDEGCDGCPMCDGSGIVTTNTGDAECGACPPDPQQKTADPMKSVTGDQHLSDEDLWAYVERDILRVIRTVYDRGRARGVYESDGVAR
jgi:hypothetical protein